MHTHVDELWACDPGTLPKSCARESVGRNETCITEMQPSMFRSNNALFHCTAEPLVSPVSVHRELQATTMKLAPTVKR